jgi:hypothetical protein
MKMMKTNLYTNLLDHLTRVHQVIQRYHHVDNILRSIRRGVTTRSCLKKFSAIYSFVSSLEPIKVEQALEDPDGVVAEGPIRRTRGGSEWELIKILLEEDGNSDKMNTASNTCLRLTTQIGQAHVATGVPLDLGTNTQPCDPRTQRNTKPRVH